MDEPGPWGTGPFTLVEGFSTLDADRVVIRESPLAAKWLTTREDRTPRVRLRANSKYWDVARGPRVEHVVFVNDLPYDRALAAVCDGEGEVDIVTEVSPADADRVRASRFAKLVSVDAARSIAGVINRDSAGLPLADARARRALNHCLDRAKLVDEAMHGHAAPLAGLAPPVGTGMPASAAYSHDPAQAARLWAEAGGAPGMTLRLSAPEELEPVVRAVAAGLAGALKVRVETAVVRGADKLVTLRRLAAQDGPQPWDVLLLETGPQAVDSAVVELHRAYVGETGEYRAGPVVPAFERLYADFAGETVMTKQLVKGAAVDKYVYDESLALFVCAPHALYGVNNEVAFTPYRTTFELAECAVGRRHWSRR